MNTLFFDLGRILGMAVIQSLWQGLIVFLVLRLIFLSFPAMGSKWRYRISFGALGVIALWFACTFFNQTVSYQWNKSATVDSISFSGGIRQTRLQAVVGSEPPESYQVKLYHLANRYLPFVALLYVTGLLFNLVKLAIAWDKVNMIKRNLVPAKLQQGLVNQFVRRLAIRRDVRVNFNSFVDVPCVVGYLKPILLLPFTITTQLSTDEVEAILLHELSHIKNNDYLFNIIQQMITVLLFMNPFVQLISRIISNEREHCCDDMVVEFTHKPLIYANALFKLQEQRSEPLKMALAATGASQFHLFHRIERIMKTKKTAINTRHLLLSLFIFMGSLVSIAWLNPEIKNGKIVSKHGREAVNRIVAVAKKMWGYNESVKNTAETNRAERPVTEQIKQADSLQKNDRQTSSKDTSRARLVNEWQQTQRDAYLAYNNYKNTDAYNKLTEANRMLDSAIQKRGKPVLSDELKHKQEEDAAKWRDYMNSEEWKNRTAVYNRIYAKTRFDIVANDPEMKKHFETSKKSGDSILKLHDKVEYSIWKKADELEYDQIYKKIKADPVYKPAFDSLEIALTEQMNAPGYLKLKAETAPSAELRAIMLVAGVENYRAAVQRSKSAALATNEYQEYLRIKEKEEKLRKRLYDQE